MPRAIPCVYEVHVLAWHHRVRMVPMGEKPRVRATSWLHVLLAAQYLGCCALCSRTASCAPHWFLRTCIHGANPRRAALGIEPRTSRTLSENHTTRPSSQLQTRKCVWEPTLQRVRLCRSVVKHGGPLRTTQFR